MQTDGGESEVVGPGLAGRRPGRHQAGHHGGAEAGQPARRGVAEPERSGLHTERQVVGLVLPAAGWASYRVGQQLGNVVVWEGVIRAQLGNGVGVE